MGNTKEEMAGFLLLGMGIGQYIPSLPAPLNILNPWLGLIFIVCGIILMLR